jgi:hypothetical protein
MTFPDELIQIYKVGTQTDSVPCLDGTIVFQKCNI